MIKNRKADKNFLTYVPHEYMGDTQGKMSDSQGSLEFRPQYQLNRSVMSNSWPPHGLQHARLLCPLLSPKVCSDSCPLSWWCHPTISSSFSPFHHVLSLFLHQDLFQWVESSISGQSYWRSSFSISPSYEYSGLIAFRIDWLDILAVQGTPERLLQHLRLKVSIVWPSAFFVVQHWHLYMITGKTIAVNVWTFVSNVMSLLFNMLSRFVMKLPWWLPWW